MIEIWATLGPASFDKIEELEEAGVTMFRLNLSHTHVDKISSTIQMVQEKTSIPLCLDTDCGKYTSWKLSSPPYKLTMGDVTKLHVGNDLDIRNVALSFTEAVGDLGMIKRICPKANIIAKIESMRGVENVKEIASNVESILIDRGDLAQSVSLEKVPRIQKEIMNIWTCCVYVATNLMETMMHSPEPTAGEVNDIWNILVDGAAGVVLAGETAIGEYPVECVKWVKRIIDEFQTV